MKDEGMTKEEFKKALTYLFDQSTRAKCDVCGADVEFIAINPQDKSVRYLCVECTR